MKKKVRKKKLEGEQRAWTGIFIMKTLSTFCFHFECKAMNKGHIGRAHAHRSENEHTGGYRSWAAIFCQR